MKFSERLGYKKPKIELQVTEIDDPLKAGLWDMLADTFFRDTWQGEPLFGDYGYTRHFRDIVDVLWHFYFKRPLDSMPKDPKTTYGKLRSHFLDSSFPETYDFLEFMPSHDFSSGSSYLEYPNDDFMVSCNRILEREKSAFRFISNQLAQITNETEIEEIEKTQNQERSASVSSHIDAAIALYSNREKPDYRNSIKESISAVEAAARELLGSPKATLGAALKELEKAGKLHSSLKIGYSSIYGWTSGGSGIRHALMDDSKISEADARYMLVSCSAFANYLLSKL